MVGLPEVSVIVPVFNSAQTVHASLNSLFQQTLTDIEVIAVNDASSDGSAQLLDHIAQDEPRLRVIHLAENVGVHMARAAGIKVSIAPYIGFLDADDFAKPQMFKVMLQACVEHDAEIAVCGISLCSQDRKMLGAKLSFSRDGTEKHGTFEKFCRVEYGTGALWNKLYQRELLLKYALVHFRWRQDATEDTLVNIGCFLDAKRIRLVRERLYEYVINPGSATLCVDKATSFVRIFRAYVIAIDVYRGSGANVISGITELYANQLLYPAYQIEDRTELAIHEQSLAEAVNLIADQYPIGLALLANHGWTDKQKTASVTKCIKLIARNAKALPGLFLKVFNRKY